MSLLNQNMAKPVPTIPKTASEITAGQKASAFGGIGDGKYHDNGCNNVDAINIETNDIVNGETDDLQWITLLFVSSLVLIFIFRYAQALLMVWVSQKVMNDIY